ncbi:DUF4321 domain-containing protein [Caldanaerobius polysaccharolyticus]|uniref:DUF4321 domain-containing protein n=1 Tax=Caldanaerobius polysaccharolyticus TaxID=44256 RepID=UPI00047DC793|nr:DUF4321 domain-containing protein [Caldanaerobius polysaccharolyticus]
MKGKRYSIWRLIVVVILGAIVGSYLAEYFSIWYKPLAYYKSIGMASPTVVDLNILKLSFQIAVKANIGTVVGAIVALYVNYRI